MEACNTPVSMVIAEKCSPEGRAQAPAAAQRCWQSAGRRFSITELMRAAAIAIHGGRTRRPGTVLGKACSRRSGPISNSRDFAYGNPIAINPRSSFHAQSCRGGGREREEMDVFEGREATGHRADGDCDGGVSH